MAAPAKMKGMVAERLDTPSRPLTVLELDGEVTPITVLLADLWRRRGLIPMMAVKEFQSRYRSATFGVLWSVILPLIQGAVLAVVFTRIVKIGLTAGDSYPIFVTSGTVTWAYFSAGLTVGSTVIVDQGAIVGKVYFPRLILAGVPALANLIGFIISMVVTVGLMPLFSVTLRPELLLIPVAMVFVFALVVGLSAVCAVAHVYFRDVRYIVQAVLMVLFYATPIIYQLDRPHGWLRAVVIANPVTGPIQLTHYAIFGHAPDLALSLAWSSIAIVLIAIATLLAYRRHERIACDRL